MIVDKYKIRKQNEAIIIEEILKYSSISRTKLSEVTGLNKASVSNITQKFLDENILIKKGQDIGAPAGGKKPILLEFNKNCAYILSIELGTDYVTYCFSTINGEIIEMFKNKDIIPNKDNCLNIIDEIYQKYKNIFDKSIYKLIGMSIAIHGITENNNISFTPYYNIDKLNLFEILSKKYNIPIFIENEANLVAICETTFLNEKNNIIAISVHSGIGVGIIINNALIKGTSGSAGEMGHSTLFPNGKQCKCGNKGCIEKYCSLSALVNSYYELTQEFLDIDEICLKFKENEQNAVSVIKENIFLFSQMVNNILTFISPDIVFIQSPLINKLPELVDKIKENINNIWSKKSEIKLSNMSKFAAVYGGVSIIIRNFFGIDKNIFINKKG